jgi:hypothetical protein
MDTHQLYESGLTSKLLAKTSAHIREEAIAEKSKVCKTASQTIS